MERDKPAAALAPGKMHLAYGAMTDVDAGGKTEVLVE